MSFILEYIFSLFRSTRSIFKQRQLYNIVMQPKRWFDHLTIPYLFLSNLLTCSHLIAILFFTRKTLSCSSAQGSVTTIRYMGLHCLDWEAGALPTYRSATCSIPICFELRAITR